MSTFEIVLSALILVGFVIPAIVISIAVVSASRKPKVPESSARFFAYKQIIDYIIEEFRTGKTQNGAAMAAAMRELKKYPEYSDLTVLTLEAVNVTGKSKFDGVMKKEIAEVEDLLLGTNNG